MTAPLEHIAYLRYVITTKRYELMDASRDKVDERHFRALLEQYWTLQDWAQKCLLVDVIQDHLVRRRHDIERDKAIEAVAADVLNAPGADEDPVLLPKIWALAYLTGIDYFDAAGEVQAAIREQILSRSNPPAG